MGRWLAAFVVAFSVATGVLGQPSACASQNDPRLDELFQRLKSTDDSEEAADVTAEIWSIWRSSGIPTVDWMLQQSHAFMKFGDLDSALGGFGLIIKSAPDFAEGWHKRATVHYLMGNFARSIDDIKKTLELEPRHFGAYAGLGLIYLRMGEDRAALEALERALEINPHLRGTRRKAAELRIKLNGKKI